MNVENPQDLSDKDKFPTFNSAEEAISTLHGVPIEAVRAALANPGSNVNYSVGSDKRVAVEVLQRESRSWLQKLLSIFKQ